MRKAELAQFKDELLTNRGKIEAYIKQQADMELEQQNNEVNDVMSKNDEGAEEIAAVLSSLAVNDSLEKTLKDINQAIIMMDQGSYGVCKYCTKDIPIARMRIRPVSTSCVECKSKFTN